MDSTYTLENEAECIEVRYDYGMFNIPGAAEVEDPYDVAAEMETSEYKGALGEWSPWERCYRCIDEHGDERWYFARAGQPADA